MSFESVESNRGPTPETEPKLVIYPSGEGRLNAAATERFFADATRASLFMNLEQRQLGLTPTVTDDGLRLVEQGRGRYLALRSVLRQLGTTHEDITESVHLSLAYDSESGLVVADADPLFREVER